MRNKYRAWDKFERRMIVDEQDFIPLIVTNKGVVRLSPKHKESLYERVDNNRFKIMQSTGLKDKNGAEIYEGDIVKPVSFASWIGVVKYSSENAAYILDGHNNEFTRGENVYLSQFNDGLEIIGNIYENPNLMEA